MSERNMSKRDESPGRPSRKIALALTLLLCAAGLFATAADVRADTLLTLKSHQDALEFQGQTQPARDETVEVWMKDGAIVRDDGQSRILMTSDKLYLINDQEKYYNVLDMPVDLANLLPEEMRPRLEQMREQAGIRAEVTPVDETRQVGDWKARRYDVSLRNEMGLEVDQVLWASPEVGVDPKLYHDLAAALAALQPGGAEWTAKLDVVEGFPVLRETRMALGPDSEVKTTEELVSVEEKDAPEGTFAPPADYEERPFNPVPQGP